MYLLSIFNTLEHSGVAVLAHQRVKCGCAHVLGAHRSEDVPGHTSRVDGTRKFVKDWVDAHINTLPGIQKN